MHPEQLVVDRAYAALDAMRAKIAEVLEYATADADATQSVSAIAVERVMAQRLAAVADSSAPLTFGRIDGDGETHYIGRRHVEDARGEPVVIDWRAPVAKPFYRATWADPIGLDLRRRFALDGRTLVGCFDEDFTDPDGEHHGGGGGIPDPLLAELERGRTGAMRDIVATIQAEQDVVIRSELDDLVVVQGGPGTGKTAVGLHRAAFLLYEHRADLESRKLLIVGPNRLFLDYIAQVLPSLGESAAIQATVETLNTRAFPVRAVESDPAIARIKGDPRMATVIRRAVENRITPPAADIEVMTAFGLAVFPRGELIDIISALSERNLATNQARDVLRQQMVALAWQVRSEKFGVSPEQRHLFIDDLRTQAGFKKALDSAWPAMSGVPIVRSLLGQPRVLAAAADGLLSTSEQQLLRRKAAPKASEERWTRHDIALLDEAEAISVGEHPVFGHVVVDEAQDLTAMELRMVGRRAWRGSMTVLGDLAQATRVGGQTDWDDALAALTLGRRDGRVAELTLGYRVPGPILDWANQLLPIAAPGVTPAASVRTSGDAPTVRRVDDPIKEAIALAAALLGRWATVGVLAAADDLDAVVKRASEADVVVRDARQLGQGLGEGINVVEAATAKGLEFDAVVVIEPHRIVESVGDTATGARVLYVSLTRAVQHLSVVHHEPLPLGLAAP
jgi:DNA helicase IV